MSNFEDHLSVSLFLCLPTLLQCEVLFHCAAQHGGGVHYTRSFALVLLLDEAEVKPQKRFPVSCTFYS